MDFREERTGNGDVNRSIISSENAAVSFQRKGKGFRFMGWRDSRGLAPPKI